MDAGMAASTVVGALVVIFGGAGIWGFLSNRSDRPIKKQEIENAEFAHVTGAYDSLVERLEARVDKLEQQVAKDGEELASQGSQIRELREELRVKSTLLDRITSAFAHATSYIEDLHKRWEHHRQSDDPPPYETKMES